MSKYTIYKARVVSVRQQVEGKPEIYVTPLSAIGDSPIEKKANPPSIIPTSMAGSGVLSMPDIGQLCLVAEANDELKVNIISYVSPDGFNSFGSLSGETLSEGSFILKVGGLNKSTFSMDRSGRMQLYSNEFSKFEIDGSRKTIALKSRTLNLEFAGGFYQTSFYREDQDTTLKNLVEHKQVYSKFTENPGFSDRQHFETEVSIQPGSLDKYVDKAIIRAGTIRNLSNSSKLMNHVYQIETRQSTFGNQSDKDTAIVLRLGYQKKHQKYGISDTYPAGTLIDWTAKRNNGTNFISYVSRVGKYEEDIKSQPVQGEIFRQQIYADKLDLTAYGTPTINPLGDGKGYDYKFDHAGMGQQYSISYGKLTSSNAPSNIAGSIKRKHIHNIDAAGNGIKLTEIFGSDQELFYNNITRTTSSEIIELSSRWNSEGYIKSWIWDDLQTDFTFDKDNIILDHKSDNINSELKAGQEGLSLLYSNDGEFGLKIEKEKIIIKTKKMTLELSDSGGLKLNGTPLVYSNFIEFFNKYTSTLGMGNMGSPVPLFSSAQAEHDATYQQTFENAKGFKTGS